MVPFNLIHCALQSLSEFSEASEVQSFALGNTFHKVGSTKVEIASAEACFAASLGLKAFPYSASPTFPSREAHPAFGRWPKAERRDTLQYAALIPMIASHTTQVNRMYLVDC